MIVMAFGAILSDSASDGSIVSAEQHGQLNSHQSCKSNGYKERSLLLRARGELPTMGIDSGRCCGRGHGPWRRKEAKVILHSSKAQTGMLIVCNMMKGKREDLPRLETKADEQGRSSRTRMSSS